VNAEAPGDATPVPLFEVRTAAQRRERVGAELRRQMRKSPARLAGEAFSACQSPFDLRLRAQISV